MAIEVTGKQIASDKITIKDVFGEDMWFCIPDYQRPYVWGEDQISSLLDDVSHSAINTPDSQYFLGSLVLHCEPKKIKDTNYQENSVLDGQQRLTTLYILQAVVRDLAVDKRLKSTCAKAIFQEGNPYDGIPERLRIEFAIRKEVEHFINTYIKEEGGTQKKEELVQLATTSKDVSIRNMANAILIISKWFEDEDNLDIDTFFPYLRQYVILVYVASSELEDAFRLFTVLNDRGIKLRNSDILKAQNLKEVSTEQKQTEYAKYWEELEGELGEDFDLFLSYIRTILVKEKARHNLLKEFEDNIYHPKKYNQSTKKYEKAEPLLKKGDETFDIIKKYKIHFDIIFSGNNYHITHNWAFDNLIKVMQDTALSDIWIPPLLVYRHYFGDYKILDFLILLDNKFSGDWIARETPTTRIDAMNSIIKKIEEIDALQDFTKDEKLRTLFEDVVFKFNSAQFLSDLDVNTIYGRRFARYILRKVDFLLDAPLYSEKRSSYNEMSVEHILPQNPEATSRWINDFTPDEREEWTHKLGNLVLISRRKNAGQGRLDFADKKAKYFGNSIESFPNSLKIMQKPQWTIKELKDNHLQLINRIKLHYNI
ncbi:DUF262 domain-containing protein [Flavobacterium croceum]|uniref:DUF262 domain-containing protein n=1 Tax=Flavobacterium croceum TaxID=370975 RepID=UPI0024A7FBC2|nr:DUF262 domain-containing HNH endonuclease family protein [Flavobacterium croceum]